MESNSSSPLYQGDLRRFFGELLQSAAKNQRLELSPSAIHYVTEVLYLYHETANFFVQKGVRIPVLADMLAEAMESDLRRRITLLKQMGDTSLMMSGFFPESLSRRSLNLSYYHQMGEIAYSHLGATVGEEVSVYDELSERFIHLSSLINEVAEETQSRDYSVLKLLEFYSSTNSDRVLEKLKRQGIVPLKRKKTPAILK